MHRIHIVGRKNSGKTTLIVELVENLSRQGYRVGTMKHTHHHHELDTPGKDSHRHGDAGATVVGILSPCMTAVFQRNDDVPTRDASRYDAMAPMFVGCDLVLVEGDLQTHAPKIEVWHAALLNPPITAEDSSISAIISDDIASARVPIWKRSEIIVIVNGILQLLNSVNDS